MKIFQSVKIGDKFKEKNTGRIITVSELTDKGFNYTCEPYSQKFSNFPPQFGTISGGQLYTNDPIHTECWDFLYEKVEE